MEEYNYEEEKFDSDIYTYDITHSEEFEEDASEDSEDSKFIIKCPNCGFLYNDEEKPKNYKNNEIDIRDYIPKSNPGFFRCPVCSKLVELTYISEEEYKKEMENKKKKQEAKEKQKEKETLRKKETYFKVNIAKFNEELKDLVEDLRERLLNEEITITKFVGIYSNISFKLFKKYEDVLKRYGLDIDIFDFRETSKFICNDILKQVKANKTYDEYLEEQYEDIEQDELYIQELDTHINDADVLPIDASEDVARQYIRDQKQKDLTKRISKINYEEKEQKMILAKEAREQAKKYSDKIDSYTKSIKYNK